MGCAGLAGARRFEFVTTQVGIRAVSMPIGDTKLDIRCNSVLHARFMLLGPLPFERI